MDVRKIFAIAMVICLTTILTAPVAKAQPNIELYIANPEEDIGPGDEVRYTIIVFNTGDAPADITFTLSGVPEDWQAYLSSTEVTLAAGADGVIYLYVTAPEDAEEGDASTITVNALIGRATQDSASFITSVLGLGVQWNYYDYYSQGTAMEVNTADSGFHAFTITGLKVGHTYNVGLDFPAEEEGWPRAHFSSAEAVDIPCSESGEYPFEYGADPLPRSVVVTPEFDAPKGNYYAVTLRVVDMADLPAGDKFANYSKWSVVGDNDYHIQFNIPVSEQEPKTVEPGDFTYYRITLENIGNTTANVVLDLQYSYSTVGIFETSVWRTSVHEAYMSTGIGYDPFCEGASGQNTSTPITVTEAAPLSIDIRINCSSGALTGEECLLTLNAVVDASSKSSIEWGVGNKENETAPVPITVQGPIDLVAFLQQYWWAITILAIVIVGGVIASLFFFSTRKKDKTFFDTCNKNPDGMGCKLIGKGKKE